MYNVSIINLSLNYLNFKARAASSKGIKALALHEDSARGAAEAQPARNLFDEVRAGKWELVFLSPEMLMSKRFNQLVDDTNFVKQVQMVVVDECHLAEEWKTFRAPYAKIKALRDRLPSRVAWVALSATIAPDEFQTISQGLGFMPGQYKLVREPVDRPTIKYVPRILQHSASSMLDFATVIPYNMKSIDEIPITVMFVNTIGFSRTLRLYLTGLLPPHLTGHARKYLIRGFHGMNSGEYRTKSIQALRVGTETRILLCTDTGTFGIDIQEVKQVIIAQLSKSFKTQTQRIGRIRGTGTGIMYYPGWVSTENMTKEALRLRGQLEKVVVDFANPLQERCPRQVACQHWGERFVQPEICCSTHNHDEDDRKHKSELALRVQEAKQLTARTRKPPAGPTVNSKSYPALDKKIVLPIVFRLLKEWRLRTWQSVPTRKPHDPAKLFMSDEFLQCLCTRIWVCNTLENFQLLMSGWEWMDIWGTALYEVIKAILSTVEKLRQEGDVPEMKEELQESQIDAGSQEQLDSRGTNESTEGGRLVEDPEDRVHVVRAARSSTGVFNCLPEIVLPAEVV